MSEAVKYPEFIKISIVNYLCSLSSQGKMVSFHKNQKKNNYQTPINNQNTNQSIILPLREKRVMVLTLRKLRFFWLYFLLLLILNQAKSDEFILVDRILVDVNGHAITLSALENELAWRQIQQPSLITKKKIIADLIDQEIMFQAADRSGILLGRWDKKVADEIQRLRGQYGSEKEFLDYLANKQLTLTGLTDRIRRQFILQSFINRQFSNQIEAEKISQAAKIYYQKNHLQFVLPATIQFQYILINIPDSASAKISSQAQSLAQTIHQELIAGKTFRQISNRYKNKMSLSDQQQPTIKVIREPQTRHTNTKLEIDIAKIDIGSISQPKRTVDGYLIAKLLGKSSSYQQPFKSVKEQIEKKLIEQQIEILLDDWLESERQNSSIQDFSQFEER